MNIIQRIRLHSQINSPPLQVVITPPPPPSSWLTRRGRIFKLLRSPRIDSKESIPPAYVARRAVRQPYSYSILAPIDCLKIPALTAYPLVSLSAARLSSSSWEANLFLSIPACSIASFISFSRLWACGQSISQSNNPSMSHCQPFLGQPLSVCQLRNFPDNCPVCLITSLIPFSRVWAWVESICQVLYSTV